MSIPIDPHSILERWATAARELEQKPEESDSAFRSRKKGSMQALGKLITHTRLDMTDTSQQALAVGLMTKFLEENRSTLTSADMANLMQLAKTVTKWTLLDPSVKQRAIEKITDLYKNIGLFSSSSSSTPPSPLRTETTPSRPEPSAPLPEPSAPPIESLEFPYVYCVNTTDMRIFESQNLDEPYIDKMVLSLLKESSTDADPLDKMAKISIMLKQDMPQKDFERVIKKLFSAMEGNILAQQQCLWAMEKPPIWSDIPLRQERLEKILGRPIDPRLKSFFSHREFVIRRDAVMSDVVSDFISTYFKAGDTAPRMDSSVIADMLLSEKDLNRFRSLVDNWDKSKEIIQDLVFTMSKSKRSAAFINKLCAATKACDTNKDTQIIEKRYNEIISWLSPDIQDLPLTPFSPFFLSGESWERHGQFCSQKMRDFLSKCTNLKHLRHAANPIDSRCLGWWICTSLLNFSNLKTLERLDLDTREEYLQGGITSLSNAIKELDQNKHLSHCKHLALTIDFNLGFAMKTLEKQLNIANFSKYNVLEINIGNNSLQVCAFRMLAALAGNPSLSRVKELRLKEDTASEEQAPSAEFCANACAQVLLSPQLQNLERLVLTDMHFVIPSTFIDGPQTPAWGLKDYLASFGIVHYKYDLYQLPDLPDKLIKIHCENCRVYKQIDSLIKLQGAFT